MNPAGPSNIDQPHDRPEQSSSGQPLEPLRLGCVSYLNTLPLIEGLGKLRDFRLTLTAPARLIDLLLDGSVDMALASIIDYQRAPANLNGGAFPLALVPAGMIGCDGPTLTVRLFSSVPLPRITRVHADADSHTSTILIRVILAELFGIRPEMVDLDIDAHRAERLQAARLGRPEPWPESMLVIGDKVITDSPPASRYPHQLDLGEAWKQLTGLPFVYACWMTRHDPAAIDTEPRVRTAANVLDRQRRHNATRLQWLIHHRAPARGWPSDLAMHYVSDLLRYDVTPAHRAGVERFFDLAHAHGLITTRRPTRWLEIA